MALEHYNRGNYGLSQRYSKMHVAAWIRLAASYDKLRRFDAAASSELLWFINLSWLRRAHSSFQSRPSLPIGLKLACGKW
jgi:hypothetical protein